MSNQKGDIMFTADIIEKVSEELGMSKASVKKHVDFLAHWIHTLAEKDDIAQIQIPHIGHIYPNVRRSYGIVHRLRSLVSKGMTLSAKQEHVAERLENKAKSIQAQYEGCGRDMLHNYKIRFSNPWFRKGKSAKELEAFQNNYNDGDNR